MCCQQSLYQMITLGSVMVLRERASPTLTQTILAVSSNAITLVFCHIIGMPDQKAASYYILKQQSFNLTMKDSN